MINGNKKTATISKIAGWLIITTLAIGAIFNLRLGFGAQSLDCIDGYVHIVRFATPAAVVHNDLIVFIAPATMGSPFTGHLAIKKVGAVAGDTVKVEKNILYVNNKQIGPLDIHYQAAKFMHVAESTFERTEVVPEGYVLAIGTKPHTYDGRYWGLLPVSSVVGSAYKVF